MEAGSLPAYLASDEAVKALPKMPAFVLKEKAALWVPCGYEAIVIGIDSTDDDSEVEDKFSFWTVQYVVSQMTANAKSVGIRCFVAARMQETLNGRLKVVEPHKKEVKLLKTSLEEEA